MGSAEEDERLGRVSILSDPIHDGAKCCTRRSGRTYQQTRLKILFAALNLLTELD